MPVAILVLAAAAITQPAAAPAAVPAPNPPIEVIAPPSERKVCKTERSISTRVVKRICKTDSQWQRDSLDARTKLRLGSANRAPPEAFLPPKTE